MISDEEEQLYSIALTMVPGIGHIGAKRLVSELIPLYKRGWVLIGVAAMPYAVYVEAIDNLDVISVASDHTEEWIKKQSRILFNKLAEKGY